MAKTQQSFHKLQGDYQNLLGIAAELVDYLEKCILGKKISPKVLEDIVHRLFGNSIDNRPGSAGSMLRASMKSGFGGMLEMESPQKMNGGMFLFWNSPEQDSGLNWKDMSIPCSLA